MKSYRVNAHKWPLKWIQLVTVHLYQETKKLIGWLYYLLVYCFQYLLRCALIHFSSVKSKLSEELSAALIELQSWENLQYPPQKVLRLGIFERPPVKISWGYFRTFPNSIFWIPYEDNLNLRLLLIADEHDRLKLTLTLFCTSLFICWALFDIFHLENKWFTDSLGCPSNGRLEKLDGIV